MQYNCPDDYFSPAATLFFNTEGTVIKSIVTGFTFESTDLNLLSTAVLGSYALFWMYFGIMTYGSAVPTGVFLFAIVFGAGIG